MRSEFYEPYKYWDPFTERDDPLYGGHRTLAVKKQIVELSKRKG